MAVDWPVCLQHQRTKWALLRWVEMALPSACTLCLLVGATTGDMCATCLFQAAPVFSFFKRGGGACLTAACCMLAEFLAICLLAC